MRNSICLLADPNSDAESGIDTAASQGLADAGELPLLTSGCRRLDLFAGLCLCIVDLDPQQGETLLQLHCPCPRPIFGLELGFHPTIHFEGVAESGKLTGSSNHPVCSRMS